ncbi:MAG TPA: hypothetical protein VHF45_06250 [Thermoleophilaceae bacterium]|nr:hypothetical protein [Thermoleophilaceae bacterium]
MARPKRLLGVDDVLYERVDSPAELRGRPWELYEQEKTVPEIARMLGVARADVAQALSDDDWWLDSSGEDVHRRPTGWPPEEVPELLATARRNGADFHHAWEIALTARPVAGEIPQRRGPGRVARGARVGATPLRGGLHAGGGGRPRGAAPRGRLMLYGVTIRQHGNPPPHGFATCSAGICTWAWGEESDALRFAAALLEQQPGARVQIRQDHVFGQLGFGWLIVLGVRVDGEVADAIAWQTAYRGALERDEQLRIVPAAPVLDPEPSP